MIKCCRPLKVEVFKITDDKFLERSGWRPAERSPHKGLHGMVMAEGEKAEGT